MWLPSSGWPIYIYIVAHTRTYTLDIVARSYSSIFRFFANLQICSLTTILSLASFDYLRWQISMNKKIITCLEKDDQSSQTELSHPALQDIIATNHIVLRKVRTRTEERTHRSRYYSRNLTPDDCREHAKQRSSCLFLDSLLLASSHLH